MTMNRTIYLNVMPYSLVEIWLNLRPSRWRQFDPTKCQYTSTRLHGVTSQNIVSRLLHFALYLCDCMFIFSHLFSPILCTWSSPVVAPSAALTAIKTPCISVSSVFPSPVRLRGEHKGLIKQTWLIIRPPLFRRLVTVEWKQWSLSNAPAGNRK
jgi:hypothetical protein